MNTPHRPHPLPPRIDRREILRRSALLGAGASACLSCAERSCVGACPHGLEIDKLTEPTHRWLAGEG